MEQLRQSFKQYQAQVIPRLEAAGEEVPSFIKEAQKICEALGSQPDLAPVGSRELGRMSITLESVLQRTAQFVEATQKLRPPLSQKRGLKDPKVVYDPKTKQWTQVEGIDVEKFDKRQTWKKIKETMEKWGFRPKEKKPYQQPREPNGKPGGAVTPPEEKPSNGEGTETAQGEKPGAQELPQRTKAARRPQAKKRPRVARRPPGPRAWVRPS